MPQEEEEEEEDEEEAPSWNSSFRLCSLLIMEDAYLGTSPDSCRQPSG